MKSKKNSIWDNFNPTSEDGMMNNVYTRKYISISS